MENPGTGVHRMSLGQSASSVQSRVQYPLVSHRPDAHSRPVPHAAPSEPEPAREQRSSIAPPSTSG